MRRGGSGERVQRCAMIADEVEVLTARQSTMTQEAGVRGHDGNGTRPLGLQR